jgi:anti-sigma-K factor RskA
MTELDDIDALAAEFVLGTLSREERNAVIERRQTDAALEKAIIAWETRLGPLVQVVPSMLPPPNLYNKIRAQIGLATNVVSLRAREQHLARRAIRWRTATFAMGALAAALFGVLGWREIENRWRLDAQVALLEKAKQEQIALHEKYAAEIAALKDEQNKLAKQYVAVLHTEKEAPAFLLTVDTRSHVCVISAIAAPKQENKSYEVWLVHDKLPKPKSLGVYKEGDMKPMPMDSGPDADMFMNATFAVSLEPEGGSPTGGPTGPVLFSGKFVQSTP